MSAFTLLDTSKKPVILHGLKQGKIAWLWLN